MFVSQDPAKDLSTLISKAKIATSASEFQQNLGKGHGEAFRQVLAAWNVDATQGFSWLNRSDFKTIPQSEIETTIATFSDLYFLTPLSAFEVMREFLESRFNKKITTEVARDEIRAEGKLELKEWRLDPTLRERLNRETRAYLDTYSPFGAGGSTIARSQSSEVIYHVLSPEGPSVILLTGVAGSGKSGVVRGVIEQLDARGITHLALRVDQHLDCTTTAALGKAVTGREESPASTLKGVAPENDSVLIVDQVDAVSEVSGRNGAVKQAVLRLVDDARNLATVRLVLVCRSFDLDSDPRLKSLKDGLGVAHVDVPLLDWSKDVEPLLVSRGKEASGLSERQKQLLCLPLNLAIFLEVGGVAAPSFDSRNDLFERLIEYRDRSVRQDRPVPWSLIAPLSTLAEWMSDRQRLDAPKDVLASYGGALNMLASEGLIVQSREHVNFFHESFFDYVYARAFSTGRQSLLDLLTSTEQHLFRRTQVRQILEALRQGDPARYIQELNEVLHSTSARYHIKVAIAQWLGSLNDPSAKEREVVLALDKEGEAFPPLVRYALLSSPGWFDILSANGWVETNLAGDQQGRRQSILWWLSSIAGERSSQVAGLLERWWSGDPEKARSLLDWFATVTRQKPDRALAELCERVIQSRPASLFDGSGTSRRELLLATWAGEHSDLGAGVLKAFLDAWFDVHPGQHPFERDQFRDLDMHALAEMAKKAPEALIEGSLGALCRAVDIIVEREAAGSWDYSFKHRAYSGHRFGADAFLGIFHSALTSLAKTRPDWVNNLLSRLDPNRHEVLTHLHLETISANGKELARNILGLLQSKYLFEAGWDGADWKSFADAAKAAIPFLDANGVRLVEDVVLVHRPEIDFVSKCIERNESGSLELSFPKTTFLYYLNRSGFEQLCILETIGEGLLTDRGQHRLRLLRRKFPTFVLPEPNHHEAHFVGSPIKRDKAVQMTDAQWLRAIARYDTDDDRRYGRTFIDGGARQLASELQQLTKEQPLRFASLVRAIPDEANAVYIQNILWGLAEAEATDDDALKQVVANAHARPNRPYGSDIARLFERHPRIARDFSTLDILLWYVEHGEANEDEATDHANIEREVISIETLLERGGRIHIRGVNGVRGWAAEALGAVLWENPEATTQVWDVLDRRIAQEHLISVRCCLMRPLVPLFNQDRERCARDVERLSVPPGSLSTVSLSTFSERASLSLMFPPPGSPGFARWLAVRCFRAWEDVRRRSKARRGGKSNGESHNWLSPIITHQGTQLLPYLLYWVPDSAKRLLYRLLLSGNETMRMIAAWHIFRRGFQDMSYSPMADVLLGDGSAYRKLAADIASHSVIHDEFRHRAVKQVIAFFNDEEKEVRGQAADVFRNIEPDEFVRFYDLAETYLESRAFEEDTSFAFFHALEGATCEVSALVIEAAEKLIADFQKNGTAGGRRHMDLHQLQDLIKREYAASERDPALRTRLLDVVDLMLSRELYGVDEIIKAHER